MNTAAKQVSFDHFAVIANQSKRVMAVFCKGQARKAEQYKRLANAAHGDGYATAEWTGEGVCPKCGKFEYVGRS